LLRLHPVPKLIEEMERRHDAVTHRADDRVVDRELVARPLAVVD